MSTSVLVSCRGSDRAVSFRGRIPARCSEWRARRAGMPRSQLRVAWGLHPLHTSAVVYISGRADPLAAAFGFLGALSGSAKLARRLVARRGVSSSARSFAFLLSALSKEAGLIFLPLWLAILSRNATGRRSAARPSSGLFVARHLFEPAHAGGTHPAATEIESAATARQANPRGARGCRICRAHRSADQSAHGARCGNATERFQQ